MKSFISRRQRGIAFTLVELLVVMGIIAILVGVSIAGVGSAIRFAKRTKANSNCVQIQTAVQSYYTEYGIYPSPSGDATGADAYYSGAAGTDVVRWQNMMYALCGNVNPVTGTPLVGTVPNSRGIAYITPTRSDLDANGILTNPFGSSGTSAYYYMAIDTDYSGVVGDSGTAQGNIPNFTASTNVSANTKIPVAGGVAVWCPCDQPVSGTPSRASFWAHTY